MRRSTMNRLICAILAAVMTLSMLPAASLITGAEEEAIVSDVPDFDVQFDQDAVSVGSAAELESALAAGEGVILLTADIIADRTFYVTFDTVIYTREARTLQRAPGFAGDLFVVGENADGEICEGAVRLSLGDPRSETADLFVIDGNRENMTVDVTGSALFVVNGMKADLYANVTVKDCFKTGNVKTLEKEEYGVSYPAKIGGAAIILCKNSQVNILGAKFTGNAVRDYSSDDETSTQGGVIYNFGALYVYGGTFENNRAGRGGVFFNYRTAHICKATLDRNASSDAGGMMYMPNSTGAYTYLGEENDRVTPEVLVRGNTSGSYGAGIYANHLLYVRNSVFSDNTNTANTGGALFCSGAVVTIADTDFTGNSALNNGGAIYVTGNNGQADVPELSFDNVLFSGNTAGGKGGAIHINGSRVYGTSSEFSLNTAKYSGAISAAEGSTLELDGVSFNENRATSTGGAIGLNASSAILNEVTGTGNSSSSGGFLYNEESSLLTVYHSTFEGNSSEKLGGAFYLKAGAVSSFYDTVFRSNSAGTNGGALGVYTSEAETVVQNCTFEGNKAPDGFGGAIHVSTKGSLKVYTTQARNNSAKQGGFLYETVTGSTVYLAGLTVSGNAATDGGPIIWGNSAGAKLYIDKAKYVDDDLVGDYEDEYWNGAIVNSLTVYDTTLVIPSYTDYDGSTVSPTGPAIDPEVSSPAQLARAIAAGLPVIDIVSDFLLDRTFYIPHDLTIRSDGAHVLTRAPGFAGDLFVVGELASGAKTEAPASLTLGDPDSNDENLLTIDGNKDQMTAAVTGSVLYVVTDSTVNLYPNVTIQNCLKVSNEKTGINGYGVSYPEKVGGAVAILTNKSFMNIYGGRIAGNGVNEEDTDEGEVCFQGGAIYNYGTLNIYDGTFENNRARAGGAIFNYRRLHVYGGAFLNNYAADSGGAVYMPNSTSSFFWSGEETEMPTGPVLFENNTAGRYGGAIYARNGVDLHNAAFRSNGADSLSGGAISAFSVSMTLENCSFENNTAGTYGGALYFNGDNGDENAREATIVSCSFAGNSAASNGGAIYQTSGPSVKVIGADFTENASAGNGGAIYLSGSTLEINGATMTGNTATCGGAIMPNTSSTVTLNNVTAVGNAASTAGFLYNKKSSVTIYNSDLERNTASAAAGALAIYDESDTRVYNTLFKENEAGTNAGAVAAYSSESPILMHSCTFDGNRAPDGFGGAIHVTSKGNLTLYNTTAKYNTAKQGGFMYETLSGSVVTAVGLTVLGNSASSGGPIIWGNTLNAVLNIDKSRYTDGDSPSPYDEAYWSEAIKNKLTVNDVSGEVPKYLDYDNEPYDDMSDAVDVSSAAELEAAIRAGYAHIRVVSDFNIDRTFYISGDTTIFSTIEHVLTRDPAFAGDVFVVGEDENGRIALLDNAGAHLVLGNPSSVKENLLVIDGNDENMTVDVAGSVIFSAFSSHVELYPNLTVRGCFKKTNERSLDPKYRLGTPERNGGAVAIISGGLFDIYGGNYINNRSCEEAPLDEETGAVPLVASNGGSFYNSGHMRIYGGLFENSEGARGGLIYNFRIVRVYGGVFRGNHSFTSGGVIYSPSLAYSHVLIGTSSGSGKTVFAENRSDGNGGCLQISALAAYVIYGNTEFYGNSGAGGGAICAYGSLSVFNTYFHDNVGNSRGGAIYLSNQKEEEVTRVVNVEDSVFENNVSPRGGAISVYASSIEYPEGGITTLKNCTFTGNRADAGAGTSSTYAGGAVHTDRKGSVTAVGCTFTDNASIDEAGTIYATNESLVTLTDCTVSGSTSAGNAGAISLHSATLTANNVIFDANSSGGNGGAIYVSYSSSREVNSFAKVTGCTFTGNSANGNGGVVYATKQNVEELSRILDVRGSTFTSNSSKKAGGAMYVITGVPAYLADDAFENNTAVSDGGAICSYGTVEMDTLTFTGNQAGTTGGAVSLQSSAETKIYSTTFTGNTAGTNGGAAVLTTDGTETTLWGCDFNENGATLGGGIYATGSSVVNVYTASGSGNTADKGGFLYVTTTGTVVTLVGAEISGNTAVTGGPVVWGNSNGAVLNIDKSKWTDGDHTGAYDEEYWAGAIVNKLTVNEVTETVPFHVPYSGSGDKPVKPATVHPVVPVTDVFNLSQSSSDGYIDSVYDKFERLDNSSNFMSTAVKVFESINGGDVTVDSYVYKTNTTTENMSVGVGLMIYQAMRYKEKHPEEEVCIDVSAYRFSVQTGVNVNRNSRYFGYVRQMKGVEYDEFGFVRISYLLVSAAKMGIHVNAIGHLDAYPLSGLNMVEYFKEHENLPCDPAYVKDGSVGDYLKFTFCNWTLDGKGGTDMMHTKLCAVSHYLDMNGVEHRNAVWTSSANLDGTTAKGYNANWKLQTATIISDHEEIYRVSVNYLRLIAAYCGQEEIYIFQDLVNSLNTEQAKLLSEGRGNEIPSDEQIIYLGTPEDDVFELYFAPFGGGVMSWDELCNPYCKYVRKLYDSEDYIRYALSVAEFSGASSLQTSLDLLISEAFHKNRNPENAVYVVADGYNSAAYDDLTVGTDIGFKFFHDNNASAPFNYVHNKDMLFSYTENGQRYYVSLLNSLNVHSGSMYFQSNQALIIKEKTCDENSVFSVMSRGFTTAPMVSHTYTDVMTHKGTSGVDHTYTYRLCEVCGKEEILEIVHDAGPYTTVKYATFGQKGIEESRCTVCGVLMGARETSFDRAGAVTATATVTNGVARLPENVGSVIDLLYIPKETVNLEAVFSSDVEIRAIALEGNALDGDSVAAISSGAPLTVYLNRLENGGVCDALEGVSGITVRDILGTLGKPLFTRKDGVNTVTIVGSIAVDDLDYDGITLTVVFSREGEEDRTYEAEIGTVYKTVIGKATISPETAAATSVYFVEGVEYLYALNVNGVPDGTYTVSASVTSRDGEDLIVGKGFEGVTLTVPNDDEWLTSPSPDRSIDLTGANAGFVSSSTAKKIGALASAPLTFEATILLPTSYADRAGVIIGSYTGKSEDQINIEAYSAGQIRLWYKASGTTYSVLFDTDVRCDDPRHIALTVDGLTATLRLDGAYAETKTLPAALPAITEGFCCGGDNRANNTQGFKGTLYGLHVFGDVRTASEIALDAVFVPSDSEDLLYSEYFSL